MVTERDLSAWHNGDSVRNMLYEREVFFYMMDKSGKTGNNGFCVIGECVKCVADVRAPKDSSYVYTHSKGNIKTRSWHSSKYTWILI